MNYVHGKHSNVTSAMHYTMTLRLPDVGSADTEALHISMELYRYIMITTSLSMLHLSNSAIISCDMETTAIAALIVITTLTSTLLSFFQQSVVQVL